MNNVINKFFLWVVLLPIRFYKGLGVNEKQLSALLKTKLIMDDRRPNSMQQMKRTKTKVSNSATLFTMFISALLGSLFLMVFSIGNNYVVQLSIYFSMYIFVLASSLISDFTSVLIDIRDNYIILPKPVNDRTVLLSRLLHILIHLCKLVFPMSLAGIIYMAINTGVIGLLLFFFFIIMATLFTLFLINSLYILILKVTTPQKFQNIIATFQIVFAIALYGSYQIVPRLVNKMELENLDFATLGKWVWIAPSYWFARAWQAIIENSFSTGGVFSIVLAVITPVASMYVVIKYFAPSFNQKLSLINNSNSEAAEPNASSIKMKSTGSDFVNKLATLICKPGAEKMAFLLCWKITGRSRDFKMKVYPSIGYLIVMLVVIFIQPGRYDSIAEHEIMLPMVIIIGAVYFSSFILIIAIAQLPFSDKYKAAWIYYSSPIAAPGLIINGAFKAIVSKFYLPLVVLSFVTGIILIGPSILPNLLLALFNELFICSLITYLTMKELPFSTQQGTNSKTGNFFRGILTFIIPSTIAVFHFFIYKITVVVYIFAVLSLILNWLVQGAIKQLAWSKINSAID